MNTIPSYRNNYLTLHFSFPLCKFVCSGILCVQIRPSQLVLVVVFALIIFSAEKKHRKLHNINYEINPEREESRT